MEQADGFGVVALGDEFEARHEVADDDARLHRRIQRGFDVGAAHLVQHAHGFRGERAAFFVVDFAEVRQRAPRPAHRGVRIAAKAEIRPQGGADELHAVEDDAVVIEQGDVVFLADAAVEVFRFVQRKAVVFVVAQHVQHRQFWRLAPQVIEKERHGRRVADVAGEDEHVQLGEVADGAKAAFAVQVAVDADFHVRS